MTPHLPKEQIAAWFKTLQDDICVALENADGKAHFLEDVWQRDGGGGGRSRIMQQGNIIEKGGVNFSAVYGTLPDNILRALQVPQAQFYATGVSIVLHPHNPRVPIIHANVRYFEMDNGVWWFGGGIDLTPHYIDKNDARFFHQALKNTCDQFHDTYYPDFKKWADDYFFIKHRNETRGIGGIFFDRLDHQRNGFSQPQLFDFVKAVGEVFAPTYTALMHKNKHLDFGANEKMWQNIRRGRYVEFNLVWDKGTKFGLDTEGRTESILMSLPPLAEWQYNFSPQPNSDEAQTLNLLKKGIDWVAV